MLVTIKTLLGILYFLYILREMFALNYGYGNGKYERKHLCGLPL